MEEFGTNWRWACSRVDLTTFSRRAAMPNLVSVVMQFLTPDMIAKIASALGLDRNAAQKAIGGAVPALLSSTADAATTPGGMRQLFNLLQRRAGSLKSWKGGVGGWGQKTLAYPGSNMLSGLFGG